MRRDVSGTNKRSCESHCFSLQALDLGNYARTTLFLCSFLIDDLLVNQLLVPTLPGANLTTWGQSLLSLKPAAPKAGWGCHHLPFTDLNVWPALAWCAGEATGMQLLSCKSGT